MYEINDNIYCYPGTDVLKNKFDIRDKTKLDAVERDLTALRIKELVINTNIINYSFDLKHLQKLHKYIFQDVYEWAGSLRTIRISKGIMFAYPENIKSEANKYFKMLKSENYLKNLSVDKFCDRLAFYKAEINMLHPFREGNGRVIREFIRTLAYNSGYELKFPLAKDDYFKAMLYSPYDIDFLKNFLKDNITKLEIVNK